MPRHWKLIIIRASALAFIGFLIAAVVIADRGEGAKWWPFLGSIPLGDKIGHIGLFGTLGLLCNLAFPARRPTRLPAFITKTTMFLLVIVSLEELSQAFIPSRSLDLFDWLADVTGLAIGQTIALVILRRSSKTKPIQHAH